MLSLFLIGTASKVTVENPPIQFGAIQLTPRSYSRSLPTLDALKSYLTASSMFSSDQINRLVNKMKFAKVSNTIEHSFDMSINPQKPSSRTARQISVVVKIAKVENKYNVQLYSMQAVLPVYSEVVTTTCKKFLWWEWDKQITVVWRPLKVSELNKVHAQIDNFVVPHLKKFK